MVREPMGKLDAAALREVQKCRLPARIRICVDLIKGASLKKLVPLSVTDASRPSKDSARICSTVLHICRYKQTVATNFSMAEVNFFFLCVSPVLSYSLVVDKFLRPIIHPLCALFQLIHASSSPLSSSCPASLERQQQLAAALNKCLSSQVSGKDKCTTTVVSGTLTYHRD